MGTEPLEHLTLLARMQDEFAATVPAVDPTIRVPWCGRWRVRNLVEHLGRIHHWAAGQAARQQETPLGRGPFDLPVFYRTHADELLSTLRRLGPDARSWTLVGDGPAVFWHRRQLHETLVHLWDLRTAAGLPLDAPAPIWSDTVDEVVTVMQPRQVRLGRMPELAVHLDLHSTDDDRTWRLGPARGADGALRVRAPSADLALMLWGRRGAADDALEVEGDRDVLGSVLEQRLTP